MVKVFLIMTIYLLAQLRYLSTNYYQNLSPEKVKRK